MACVPRLMKSTNVRVSGGDAPRPLAAPAVEARRTLAAGLGFWAAAVALGAADGVFARLGAEVGLALAAFATAFALAAYALDDGVRGAADRLPLALLALLALCGDAALALAGLGAASDELLRGHLALVAFFAAPLALAAHAPALRGLARRRLRSAAARSPGASRAAT